MAGKPEIIKRTYNFSLKVLNLCDIVNERPGIGWALSRQLLRAATSVGANVEEAQAGQSRADFINKYAIALKEARETAYWLRLLRDSQKFPTLEDEIRVLLDEAGELARVIGVIVVNSRRNSQT
jgi:four helix bundle protein